MLKRQEEILWVGDGFSSARDQIGRRVNIDGKAGVVVEASELYITVEWDFSVVLLAYGKCLWKWFLSQMVILNITCVAFVVAIPLSVFLGLAIPDNALYQLGKYLFLVGIVGFFLTIKWFPWFSRGSR